MSRASITSSDPIVRLDQESSAQSNRGSPSIQHTPHLSIMSPLEPSAQLPVQEMSLARETLSDTVCASRGSIPMLWPVCVDGTDHWTYKPLMATPVATGLKSHTSSFPDRHNAARQCHESLSVFDFTDICYTSNHFDNSDTPHYHEHKHYHGDTIRDTCGV